MPRIHSSPVSDSWAVTSQVVPPALQPAAGNQSTTSTTFEVGNFDIGFSLSDDDYEFDTSSYLFI